jgi:uncharacterized Zn finger protein (UPF0148 family)
MPIIPCPRCKTPLEVLERSMTGHVRCPNCDEAFTPRTALETAVQVPSLELPPRSEPAPMPRPSRFDDDEPETREERERRRRLRRRRRYMPRRGWPNPQAPVGHGVALAARILLGLAAAAEFGLLAVDLRAFRIAENRFQATEAVNMGIGLQVLILIPTGLVFLVWFNQAYRNLTRMQVADLSWSGGWSIGGFFLPLANLVIPCLVAQEIWRASRPEQDLDRSRGWKKERWSAAITLWWLLWIAANILFIVAAAVMDSSRRIDPDVFRRTALVLAAMHLSAALAAAILIYVIGAVVRRQEAKWATLMPLDDDSTSEYDDYDT